MIKKIIPYLIIAVMLLMHIFTLYSAYVSLDPMFICVAMVISGFTGLALLKKSTTWAYTFAVTGTAVAISCVTVVLLALFDVSNPFFLTGPVIFYIGYLFFCKIRRSKPQYIAVFLLSILGLTTPYSFLLTILALSYIIYGGS